jgi:hypothetical protein
MKKTCIYCGKTFDDQKDLTCPHCQKSNDVSHLTVKGVHEVHQNAHNSITKYTDVKNSGLVFIVIGTILLIIGGLFLFLSFKYNPIRVREFRPDSVEFVVSVICLTASLAGLVYGIYRLILSLIRLSFYKKVIRDIHL